MLKLRLIIPHQQLTNGETFKTFPDPSSATLIDSIGTYRSSSREFQLDIGSVTP